MAATWEDSLGLDARRLIIGRLTIGMPGRCRYPDDSAAPVPVARRPSDAPLTPQEARVATLLCDDGLSYDEIANELGNAYGTVSQLASRVYRKLGVHRRRDACVRLAAGRGG